MGIRQLRVSQLQAPVPLRLVVRKAVPRVPGPVKGGNLAVHRRPCPESDPMLGPDLGVAGIIHRTWEGSESCTELGKPEAHALPPTFAAAKTAACVLVQSQLERVARWMWHDFELVCVAGVQPPTAQHDHVNNSRPC